MSTPASAPAQAPAGSRYGWVMVGLTPLFLGMGNGGLGALSVFLKPISAEFGWLRGETSFAYLAGTFAMGVGGIVMGHLADRMPVRRIVQVGAVVLGLAYLALSRQQALWQFYGLYVLMAGFGAAAFFTPLLANLGRWFTHNRGLALGLATAGQALGQGAVPYLAALLIAAMGWRGAYVALAAIVLVVLLPATLLIRQPPQPAAAAGGAGLNAGDAPPPVPWKIAIALLCAASVFCCITMATPLIHVVALASDAGMGVEASARVLLLMLVAGMAGRISFGRLTDTVGGLPAYMLASFWQTALVYGFVLVQSPGALYTLAMVYGFGYAGVMTTLLVSAQQFVPASRTGMATGLVTLSGMIGMGLGAFQAGLFFDLTGDYHVSFANAAGSGVVNLVLLAALIIWRLRGQRALRMAPTAA